MELFIGYFVLNALLIAWMILREGLKLKELGYIPLLAVLGLPLIAIMYLCKFGEYIVEKYPNLGDFGIPPVWPHKKKDK